MTADSPHGKRLQRKSRQRCASATRPIAPQAIYGATVWVPKAFMCPLLHRNALTREIQRSKLTLYRACGPVLLLADKPPCNSTQHQPSLCCWVMRRRQLCETSAVLSLCTSLSEGA
eukprot:3154848-Pleurochrysis_carterae.AAC.3